MENTLDNVRKSPISEIVSENTRRNAALRVRYNPMTGEGCCGPRTSVGDQWLPTAMLREVSDYFNLPEVEQRRVRIHYDFEFWCATCATIRDKLTGRNVKLRLNAPQRRVLRVFERQRLGGKGIRVILLKARQWGGSTLTLMYMAWFQLVLKTNWNCLICGHKRNSAKAIKGMYSLMLRNYPIEMLENGIRPAFKGFEGGGSTKVITGRECLVIMGSAQSEDAVRGFNISMAHLSEVAFWPESPMHNPEDTVRSVDGAILMGDLTLVVMESTANGVGTFFHEEWMRAKSGLSDKEAVFVPWHEIELYRLPVTDAPALWESLDDYELNLWAEGCTLEMLNWYHHKRRAYTSHCAMMAEFPSNDLEAFENTGKCVFDLDSLDRMRDSCRPPRLVGDIDGDWRGVGQVRLLRNSAQWLKVWEMPQPCSRRDRYVVSVDIGGRSDQADFSVIAVLDRKEDAAAPIEVVAQWRGHLDHDLLAWKAAQVAKYYHNAKLVFESNTLEMENREGDDGTYILDLLKGKYGNLYRRPNGKLGFQTNKETKGKIVHNLIAMARDGGFVEHDSGAIDEMSWFAHQPGGRFGAIKGKHDDMVMARAIGLYVCKLLDKRKRLDCTCIKQQPPLPFHP